MLPLRKHRGLVIVEFGMGFAPVTTRAMALRRKPYCRRLGLAVGISSGANFLGAIMAQNQMGHGALVATVFPDDNKKYISTDLLRDEPVKSNYLAPEVELLGYEAFKRVCFTCFDGED